MLRKAGLDAVECPTLDALCAHIGDEAAALVIAEEALAGGSARIDALARCLQEQPSWSDLPVVVLAAGVDGRGERAERARETFLDRLGNVTLLNRPLHSKTLLSAVRAAVRARRRQYQTRAHLLELQRFAGTLEARVEDRTNQLQAEVAERLRTEAMLRQAQKLDAIGQLTGGLAHDFNNLLTAVLGNLELLERRLSDERNKKLAASATRAASRGAKLTQQLLAFGRRQTLRVTELDASEVIAGMLDLLTRTIGPMIELRTDFQPHLWLALADQTQFEMIVLNLCINARDAMPDGGTLRIATENVSIATGPADDNGVESPGPGDYVRLTVADTGIGMLEEVQQRAFEPFFTTKEVGKGTGLGLSQVYGIAKQLGGGVTIDSRVGKGTTLAVYLPRAAVVVERRADSVAPMIHPSGISSVSPEATILVVDDDEDVRAVMVSALENLGFSVLLAGSGAEALALIDAGHAVDLLLVDYAMPGMTGAEVLLEARRRHPSLRALLVSGYVDGHSVQPPPDVHMLRKPFEFSDLAAAVVDVLGESE